MDIKFTQKAKDNIGIFSEKYVWFSELYNVVFNAIKVKAEKELLHMEINKPIPHVKENWKEVCRTSVYRLKITYVLKKDIDKNYLFVLLN